jgi:hypothetical protein
MKRFQLLVLAASIVGISPPAFFLSAMPAQATQCVTERPPNARSHWSYRLIDSRKCWYAGKPMLSKSMLYWSPTRTTQARKTKYGLSEAAQLRVLTDENTKLKKLLADAQPYRKPNGLPANYTLLDAQASIQDDSLIQDESFEALWRVRFLEAIEK